MATSHIQKKHWMVHRVQLDGTRDSVSMENVNGLTVLVNLVKLTGTGRSVTTGNFRLSHAKAHENGILKHFLRASTFANRLVRTVRKFEVTGIM